MFILAHLGITLGAAVMGSGVATLLKGRSPQAEVSAKTEADIPAILHLKNTASPAKAEAGPGPQSSAFSLSNWLERLSGFLDIRWLLIGSLLPDLIDKPVGNFIFSSVFHSGRIFSHTLVFLLVLSILGIWLYISKKRTWLLAIAIGVLFHLVLDFMWADPTTLLWPFFGWKFPPFTEENVLGYWWQNLLHKPMVFVPELIGAAVLVVFVYWLARGKSLAKWVVYGKVR